MTDAPAPATPAGAATRPEAAADRRVWDIAATVCDPEVPVLTLEDLGILRSARATEHGAIVEITPTYSGCPAVGRMRDDVTDALTERGYTDVSVRVVLSPAWTTDWMTEDGKRKLEEYGIAPPDHSHRTPGPRFGGTRVALSVKCPHCDSLDTREVTRFGSTACKAHYVCRACLEPFDYFKVL
ncbi:1,2-phenylacetyl-CoA epoxidase subunit PaaD [Mobilicoccus caccae]|uniref:Phenylacetate-CoA oxygenase subunit PaaJ n=1 Tax=Mobilicoccus caccae TaxID=1859295 RepID=A0ABQ6IMP7_9MICO|nr:1,2-phenylacetyl-CoA epoxidase subunit PaaD [Mobilicoccus caccae]GMA39192.1 phenylacetate-CoA oxygenase subunit PaaJ [Mobilicoccus caccae]